MTAALATTILSYLLQYGLPAISVLEQLIVAAKQLLAKGRPTPEEIHAAALDIEAMHDALPKPTGS